tara:strand:- start:7281 stop:8015 length:735 start_codon:yes stop_codon:yes gene_type:complete
MYLNKKYHIVFLLWALIFYSCGKKGCVDSVALNFNSEATRNDGSCVYSPPLINLFGKDTISLCLEEDYIDSGVFAQDVFGEDITSLVEVVSNLDNSNPGEYVITYTVLDVNGNSSSLKRVVNVNFCSGNLVSNYSVFHDCQINLGITEVDLISDSQTIVEGDFQNQILIQDFNQFISQVVATVENENIIIEQNTFSIGQSPLSFDVVISGTGLIDDSGNEIIVNYAYNIGSLEPGNCQATYIKQ